MKKSLYISFIAIIILSNIFIGECILKFETYNFLYSEPSVSIKFTNTDMEKSDIFKHLEEFSKNNNVNISQYIYIDRTRLNIYSTDIKNDLKLKLKSGSYPQNTQYISNFKVDKFDKKQIGMFHSPIADFKIKIYNFDQIRNVGMDGIFYLRNGDSNIANKFVKEFSKYGEINFESEQFIYIKMINRTLLYILAFTILAFIMISFLMIIKNRKKLLLKELWGYSRKHFLIVNYLEFSKVIISVIGMGFLTLLIILNKYNQMYYVKKYIFYFIVVNALLISSMILLIFLECLVVKKISNTSLGIKNKLPLERLHLLSMIMKIIIYIIIIFTIISTISNLKVLNSKLENFKEWEKSKNIYNIVVSNIPDYKMNDLAYERDLNNRSYEFYKQIKKNNEGFLIYSGNFTHKFDGKNMDYFYTINTSGEEEIYDPHGRSVTIDTGYLKVNPIKTISNKSIEKLMDENEDVLNILVPKKYKKYEEKIKENYRDYFYFKKIDVENIYNRKLKEPLNTKSIETLKINIIYVKNNQSYFTFSEYTGGLKNSIKDPIAIIYNGNVDNDYIGAYLTSSVYIVDRTKGSAFESIKPAIEKTNLSEIRCIESVYSSINARIIKLKKSFLQNIISLLIGLIIAVVFIILIVWSNFQIDIYKIIVMYTLGYSSIKRNLKLILGVVISNLIVFLIIHIFNKSSSIIVSILGITIFELFFIITLGNKYCKNNIQKISKGDNI